MFPLTKPYSYNGAASRAHELALLGNLFALPKAPKKSVAMEKIKSKNTQTRAFN